MDWTHYASQRLVTENVNGKFNKEKHGLPNVLVKRFLDLCFHNQPGRNPERLAEKIDLFVDEELESLRLNVKLMQMSQEVAARDKESLAAQQEEVKTGIKELEEKIAEQRQLLEQSKVFKQQQLEYSELKKSIMKFPSRQETEMHIQAEQEKIELLQKESCKVDHAIALRKKQFAQLALVIRELHTTDIESYLPVAAAPEPMELG